MGIYGLELTGGLVFPDLAAEEVIEHAHVERFSPPSRACDEQGFKVTIRKKLFDQKRFVNKDIS